MQELSTVTVESLANLFQISENEVHIAHGSHEWPRLTYRVLAGSERDGVLLSILKVLDEAPLRVVGKNDRKVWEKGWGEILDRVRSRGFDPTQLRPQYFEHHRILRFRGEYIDTSGVEFVYEYDHLIRRLTFYRWLRDMPRIVELGCGTGNSQLLLAEVAPAAGLVASDWASPSQELVRFIAAYLKRPIKPVRFNMLTLEGWDALEIDSQSAVLTVHSLEQLGAGHGPLLDRLVAARPRLCVHIEPIEELYHPESLFDYLGLRYHRKRNYLTGWLDSLRRRQSAGRLTILEQKRIGFGDRYHEAYNVVVWACA